ncbi:MAG: ACT domain-containing protein [Chloroflexi bacterium]|nr:ACT domain-containing protein [Chloroflexota bacterium]
MATEIVIETQDRPGVIAAIGELFGEARVNIRAAAAFTHEGRGFLHFVVDDPDRALATLKQNGWKVIESREVLSVSVDDRPGELGRYARRLADAGISITTLYTGSAHAGDQEIIVAVDDVTAARRL